MQRFTSRLAWPSLIAAVVAALAWTTIAYAAIGGSPDVLAWGFPLLVILVSVLAGTILATDRRNATDHHHLALRLAAAHGRAQMAERARGRALGVMSAEFRTPLNAIMVFAELLSKGFVDGSPRKRADYAASIFTTGQQLIEKLDALLDQARLEAGELQLNTEEVDPKRLLDLAARFVEADAKAGGVALDLPADPTPFLLHADARRLRHILAVLLGNAVRLTRREGCVSVEMRIGRDGSGEIVLAHTGNGMTEDELAQALDPTANLDGVVAHVRESSWRGLWLAKSLTELHGATLKVRSAPTAGTTVSIAFPADAVVARPNRLALAAD